MQVKPGLLRIYNKPASINAPSQSSDPESPHHADQTELYSRKQWVRFPYCEEEIAAAQIGETVFVDE